LFLQIKYALNRVWGIPPTPPGDRFAFLKQQLFAFIMLMALGLLIILATLVNLVFAWFGTIVQYYIGRGNLLTVFNMLALFGLLILAFAFVHKVLPDLKVAWRVWPGSIMATLLTALGGLLRGLYFSLGGVHSAFEAAGAFAVLMIAIYFFCPDLPAGTRPVIADQKESRISRDSFDSRESGLLSALLIFPKGRAQINLTV